MDIPEEIQKTVDEVKGYLIAIGVRAYVIIPSAKKRVVFALYVEMLEELAVASDSTYWDIKNRYTNKMMEVVLIHEEPEEEDPSDECDHDWEEFSNDCRQCTYCKKEEIIR